MREEVLEIYGGFFLEIAMLINERGGTSHNSPSKSMEKN